MASRSLNKVMLIGNLTRDPEMRYTANGNPVCVFGIATNRSWKDSNTGDVKEEAEFINIVTWGKLAEICHELLAKGMLVYLEGEIRTRTYQNSNGETVYRTEIHVSDMQLLNDKGKTAPKNESVSSTKPKTEEKSEKQEKETKKEEDVLDDDLVF